MRKNIKSIVSQVALTSTMLAVSVTSAFAQVAPAADPTTAVQLAKTVSMADAQSAGLIVIGLLVAAGVVLWGGRLVLSKFQPKL